MCEERILKMKKDMRLARRRARRLMQVYDFIARPNFPTMLDHPTSSDSDSSSDSISSSFYPRRLTKTESLACLRDVTDRTVVLMKRNEEIQRRVEELKRDTADFLNDAINNRENQMRFRPYLRTPTPFQTPPTSEPFSEDSSTADDELRSLPDTENADANDSYDVELKPEVKFKEGPLDDY